MRMSTKRELSLMTRTQKVNLFDEWLEVLEEKILEYTPHTVIKAFDKNYDYRNEFKVQYIDRRFWYDTSELVG